MFKKLLKSSKNSILVKACLHRAFAFAFFLYNLIYKAWSRGDANANARCKRAFTYVSFSGAGAAATPYPLHPPSQPQPVLPPYTPYSQHGAVQPPGYMPSVAVPTLPAAQAQAQTSAYQQQQVNM